MDIRIKNKTTKKPAKAGFLIIEIKIIAEEEGAGVAGQTGAAAQKQS